MTSKQRLAAGVVFAVYLLLLAWLVLFKLAAGPETLPRLRGLNLIPFAGSAVVNGRLYWREILLNCLAFAPLGVCLSLLRPGWRLSRRVLCALGLSLFFEAAQYLLALGGSDVTDLLANTLGGLLGCGLYALLRRALGPRAGWAVIGLGGAAELCALALAALLALAN